MLPTLPIFCSRLKFCTRTSLRKGLHQRRLPAARDVTAGNGSPLVYTGSGESDTPIGNGVISTAGNGSSPRGYQVTVSVESFFNGSWQPSSVMQGSTSIMYYNLILVVSEDYIDNDWNDAAVTLTWWVPSQTCSLSEFNVEAKVTGDSPTAATE
jgi:hypothetical protein